MRRFFPIGTGWPGLRFSSTNHGIASISHAAEPKAIRVERPQLFCSALALLWIPYRIATLIARIKISPMPEIYSAMLDSSFRFMLSAVS